MGLWTILLLAVALCFDSFAVSLGAGLSCCEWRRWRGVRFAIVLAIFQGAMPLFGWALAWNFHHQIARWDHWIAFSLLWILGIKMIYDSFAAKSDEPSKGDMLNLGQSVLMGVATSIDAIIAGVTMALVSITILPAEFSQFGNVVLSCGIISMVTFSASILGLLLGRSSRHSVGRHASVVGGVVLMAIGLKVLVEHLTT